MSYWAKAKSIKVQKMCFLRMFSSKLSELPRCAVVQQNAGLCFNASSAVSYLLQSLHTESLFNINWIMHILFFIPTKRVKVSCLCCLQTVIEFAQAWPDQLVMFTYESVLLDCIKTCITRWYPWYGLFVTDSRLLIFYLDNFSKYKT